MVARKFLVRHNDSQFDLDYDTEDGLEVLKFQLFSLTSVLPDEQKLIGGENLLITEDSDLNSISDHLRLISITDDDNNQQSSSLIRIEDKDESSSSIPVTRIADKDEQVAVESSTNTSFAQSDEELARMLQAEEEALFFQQFRSPNDNREEFERRVRPYVSQVLMYEDSVRQQAARKTVPVEELEEKALVSLAKEGNFEPSKVEKDHAFLLQLLFWFKKSFRWVNSPPCDGCGSGTVNCGMGVGLPFEIQFGGSRVELYRCNNCGRVTRFPRYNDPIKLVETRRGRCGEWANCFTLYCRAFGYDSRLILDFSDHVWTECYSHYLGRWMHLDPCEGIYDNPLLYEKGWNKKLSYVIAFAKGGVHDVTKRYTRKWHEVLTRRDITTESVASAVLSDITKECRRCFTSEEISLLENGDKIEAKELERDLHSKDENAISLPGRQSGAKEWRLARLELDSDDNCSLSSSSCPARTCVDKHVTSIYNAMYPLLSHFVDKGLSYPETVEIIEVVKRLLVDLSGRSFRTRKTSISSDSNVPKFFEHEMMPAIKDLLDSLSLKAEIERDGRVNICLADDPVKTAISLPVALDAFDDLIANFEYGGKVCKDSLLLPFLKLNRISSGQVLASGEELPFGIVTSAFDGTHMSKWEEPNGSRGLWRGAKTGDQAGTY